MTKVDSVSSDNKYTLKTLNEVLTGLDDVNNIDKDDTVVVNNGTDTLKAGDVVL